MTLSLTHLRSQDYRDMPWKNGGGSTTELAIFPRNASMHEPFLWRISLAQLNGSGPFSTFPAYERSIVQLSGPPMRLVHEGRPEKQLLPLQPYSFQGEWVTEGKLEGSAEDFNLMVRREALKADLECLHLKDGEAVVRTLAATTFLWVFQGEIVWESLKQRQLLQLRDSLIIESSDRAEFRVKGQDAILFLARMSPRIMADDKPRGKDPLMGLTLENLLNELVNHYGWEYLGKTIPINCFLKDPSIRSSLTFLRKTPWARTKVERLYIAYLEETSR